MLFSPSFLLQDPLIKVSSPGSVFPQMSSQQQATRSSTKQARTRSVLQLSYWAARRFSTVELSCTRTGLAPRVFGEAVGGEREETGIAAMPLCGCLQLVQPCLPPLLVVKVLLQVQAEPINIYIYGWCNDLSAQQKNRLGKH